MMRFIHCTIIGLVVYALPASIQADEIDTVSYELMPKLRPPDSRSERLRQLMENLTPGDVITKTKLKSIGIDCDEGKTTRFDQLLCLDSTSGAKFFLLLHQRRLYVAQFYLLPGQFGQLFPNFMVNVTEAPLSQIDIDQVVSTEWRNKIQKECAVRSRRCEVATWKKGSNEFEIIRKLIARDVFVFTYVSGAIADSISKKRIRI